MLLRKLLAVVRLRRFALAFAATALLIPGGAAADICVVSDDAAAESFVRDLHGRVSGTAGKGMSARAKLNAFICAKVPVDVVSRYALGVHWRTATAGQRAEYQKLFELTVFPGLADQILRFRAARYTIVDNRHMQSNDRLVTANVTGAKGGVLKVGWRLNIQNCTATATDMIVDGVSLMVMKRQEFASVISREGIDGLIEKMRVKAIQIKGGDRAGRGMSQSEMGEIIEDLLRGAASKFN
jgi:phospholipid transport system substrate-binding protein